MTLTTYLKLQLKQLTRPFMYLLKRSTHRFRDDVECAKCRLLIPRKSRRLWSRWYGGYIEYLCIPTIIRNLGSKQVKIYLRHGTEALYPTEGKQK